MTRDAGAEPSEMMTELEANLERLDLALAEARRAASAIRTYLPSVTALAEVVHAMETAVDRARQGLRPVAAPVAQTPVSMIRPTPPTAPERAAPPATFEPKEEEQAFTAEASRLLRMNIASKSSSLDLKAVDAAIGEQSEVVDIALLDYNGRQATLDVWLSEDCDPIKVRDALLSGLQRRLGGDDVAEVTIDLQAAA